MEYMWQCGRTRTVKQVMQALNDEIAPLAYTTIMTTMARLVDKGLLNRRRFGLAYTYGTACTMAEFVELQERAIRESLGIERQIAA